MKGWAYVKVDSEGMCDNDTSHHWRLVAKENQFRFWCCRGCSLLKAHNFIVQRDYFYFYEEVDDVNE